MSRLIDELENEGSYVQRNYLELGRTMLMSDVLMATEDCVCPDPMLFQKLTDDFHEVFAFFDMGSRLTGHRNVLHGGALATLLDETLCFCGFALLPHKVGVTANLNIDYCAPSPANSKILVHAHTANISGRKVWVEAATYIVHKDTSLSDLGNPTMKARLLVIEPKWYEKLLE